MNMSGGICTDCIQHDEHFKRMTHAVKLGGMAADPNKKAAEIGLDGRQCYRDHTGYTFAIRLQVSDSAVKVGHYFLTVEAAPAVARDTRLHNSANGSGGTSTGMEDEDESSEPAVYSYWVKLEEREPRGKPTAGNKQHLRAIEEEKYRAITGNLKYVESTTEFEQSERRRERREWLDAQESNRRYDRTDFTDRERTNNFTL